MKAYLPEPARQRRLLIRTTGPQIILGKVRLLTSPGRGHPQVLIIALARRDQFDRSAAACAEIGWTYVIYTGLPEPLRSNLRFVAGFRADRFALHDDLVAQILEACPPEGCCLRDILDEAARITCSTPRALAGVYHMLWCGDLNTNLDAPLSATSRLVR